MGKTNDVETKYLHPAKRESLDSVTSTTALGAAFVIVSSLMIITVWKCCCRMKISKKKKEYWLNAKGKENSRKNLTHPSVVQSNSVVFLGLKPTQVYDCHKLEKFPEESFPSKPISFPNNEDIINANKTMIEPLHVVSNSPCAEKSADNRGASELKRSISNLCGPQYSPPVLQTHGIPQSTVLQAEPVKEQVTKGDIMFPYNMNIPSIIVQRDDSMRSSPAFYHRTFYSGTFDQHSLYSCDSQLSSEIDLKTCSLTWSNYSLRPMSTGDCYYDLFQRASFCKKRKNRMRSDIAAAIAMNRSQSSQLNKDTESLVENEVEIVLDERTTL